MLFAAESEALKKSAWPRCDQLAAALVTHGASAADAIEAAASSKTLHVRSAALRALNQVDPERGKALATRLLEDRAYEVRETAAHILGVAVPEAKSKSTTTKAANKNRRQNNFGVK